MKVLKFLLYAVLAIIIVVLIAGIFIRKDFHYEKTKEINASKDVVWNYVVNYSQHEKWSQWKQKDPKMKTEISGTDGAVGSKMTWSSDDSEVGSGSQTITNIIPGERIDVQLDFNDRGKPTSFYKFSGDSTKCSVTWGLDMHMGYPMNVMGAMMGGMMDKMFDKGLGMLKDAAENKK